MEQDSHNDSSFGMASLLFEQWDVETGSDVTSISIGYQYRLRNAIFKPELTFPCSTSFFFENRNSDIGSDVSTYDVTQLRSWTEIFKPEVTLLCIRHHFTWRTEILRLELTFQGTKSLPFEDSHFQYLEVTSQQHFSNHPTSLVSQLTHVTSAIPSPPSLGPP